MLTPCDIIRDVIHRFVWHEKEQTDLLLRLWECERRDSFNLDVLRRLITAVETAPTHEKLAISNEQKRRVQFRYQKGGSNDILLRHYENAETRQQQVSDLRQQEGLNQTQIAERLRLSSRQVRRISKKVKVNWQTWKQQSKHIEEVSECNPT